MKSTGAANEVNEKKTNDLAASDVSIQCLDYVLSFCDTSNKKGPWSVSVSGV